jgi:hypothetical protein
VVEGGSSDDDSDPEEEDIWKVGPIGKLQPVWLTESMQAMKASMPKADGDDDDDDGVDDGDDDSLVEYPVYPDEHDSSDIEGDQEERSDAEDDGIADWEFAGVGSSSSSDASDADDSVNPDASVPSRNLTYGARIGWICHTGVTTCFGRWQETKAQGTRERGWAYSQKEASCFADVCELRRLRADDRRWFGRKYIGNVFDCL